MLEHVVVVTDSLSVDGGSARVALTSAVGLARAGIRVTVFAASGRASDELSTCENLSVVSTDQGEALTSTNRIGGAVRGLWNRTARKRMLEVLATLDRRNTVVHVHGWTKALSSSVIAAVVDSRFPVVVTLHEYFTACPTGCLYLHRDRDICKLTPMSPACIVKNCDSRNYLFKMYRVLRQVVQQGAGAVPRGVSEYITVSNFSRRVLQPMLPAQSSYHAIDNPVDAKSGPRVTAEANRSFLYIGRLSPEKGATLFADAARRAGVKAVVVGEGPDRSRIARIYPEAKLLGWCTPAAVVEELRAARCLVVPSLWYETFGLVVLEAAAFGIPSIVPSDTAASELIAAGKSGLVFQRGNVDDLTTLLKLLDDDNVVQTLSRGAYDTYWRNPRTMDLHIERLLSTYEQILHHEMTQPYAERRA